MARITGSVPVTGFVAPTSDSDTYASHSEEWGRGGYRSVYSITDRNNIPYQRRLEGMLVHVKKNGNTYRLDGGVQNINWEIRQEGGGEGEGLTPELQEWLLDRLNHTGTQPISTIEELEEALLGKVDKDGYKQLSEQNFTEELRDIVLSVEPSHFKGLYPNEEALLTAYPTGVAGDEAQVDSGAGLPVAVYIWDAVNTGWTLQQGVSALPSAPQVRQLYLANPDTKEFKGADRVKLDNIAPESTKNSLDSFLLNRANHSGKQPIESVEGLALALQTALENSLTEEQKDAVDEMVVGATKNKTDDFLLNRANHTGTQTMATIEGLAFKFLALESSAMTALEKDLLSTVQRDATKNASDEELLNRANHEGTQSLETIDGLAQLLAAKVDKVGNKQLTDENFSTGYMEKLAAIAPEATKNSLDSFLLNRANHTGVQPISTITGLQNALDSKVDNNDSRLTNSREWTASIVTQAEAEAGVATSARKWTAQRVRQAILGWWNTSSEKTKLDGIQTGAQVNTVTSVAGKTGAVSLAKADVGLGNVDNVQQAPITRTITAGTGLTGGGNLTANRTLNVSYGTTAGTAAQGNDSRLSNSREWTAATVSQAEAESGTATTRRAWTAQRVRQAIAAWWQGATSTLGRTLVGRSTAAEMRGDLGLGAAATKDVGTDAGNVMGVGAGGWLGRSASQYIGGYPQDVSQSISQIYRRVSDDEGVSKFASSIHFACNDTWGRLRVSYNSERAWVQGGFTTYSAGWTAELLHTGNTIVDTNGFIKQV